MTRKLCRRLPNSIKVLNATELNTLKWLKGSILGLCCHNKKNQYRKALWILIHGPSAVVTATDSHEQSRQLSLPSRG